MTPAVHLRLTDIRLSFGATQALKSVSLAVAPGEVHALIFENGAGTSALMKVLSGAHAAVADTMDLVGSAYQHRNPHDARIKGVAMIY